MMNNTPTVPPVSAGQAQQPPITTHEALTVIVSELCGLEPAQIGRDFVLASSGRLRSSLGRATLDAKIRRRLGVKIENLHTLHTFGELEAALGGNRPGPTAVPPEVLVSSDAAVRRSVSPAQEQPPAKMPASDSGLACGIDVELVSALPEAKDFWEEPFYKANFTPAEIAYCIAQPNPRTHFAARWCAKEAFRKCRPAYAGLEMNMIEVVRDKTGQPHLRVLANEGTSPPPVALSLTHSEDWAFALAVSTPQQPPPALANPIALGKRSCIGIVLGLAALVCSLVALALALIHK